MITSSDLDISSVSDELLGKIVAESAFQRATPSREIGIGEQLNVFTLSNFAPAWVAEGATKPALSDGVEKIEVKSAKQAFIVVFSEEAEISAPNLVSALEVQAPAYFARTYDRTVAGEIAAPSALFHTLDSETITEVDLSTGYSALLSAYTTPENGTSAWVLSNKLYGRILGMTDSTGRPLIDPATNTLLGVPVYRFNSTEAVGYVGDFEGSAFHGVTVSPKVRIARDGNVVDSAGVEHNLTQQDKSAVILESYSAFGAANVDANFVKLVFNETPETPETPEVPEG